MKNNDLYRAYIRESKYVGFNPKIFWTDFFCLNDNYDCVFIDNAYKYMIELNNQNIQVHSNAICVIVRISINKRKNFKFITKYIIDNYQILQDKYKAIYEGEDYEIRSCAKLADICYNLEREYKLKRIIQNEEL